MGAASQVESLDSESFVINSVVFDAPWSWLAAGWRDISATPVLSLGYGLIFALISMGLAYGLTQFGWQSVVIALAGGFLILGPLFAVGLYEISRRRSEGEVVAADTLVHPSLRSPGQLAFMGFILLFIFSAWLRIAFLLFAVFFGSEILPPVERFIPELLFTPHGLGLLIVGTATGAALGFIAYTVSVVSIPLLMEHRVDVYTAISVSIRAVAKNLNPMLLWAVLIAAIMGCGIATGFLGLIVAFPLVGHATWHAYRELVHSVPQKAA
jgi:uncharacterized membrane protein